jgi:hypothetical protein
VRQNAPNLYVQDKPKMVSLKKLIDLDGKYFKKWVQAR